MPAKSKSQQQAMAIALAAKRGRISKSKLKGPSREMAESMSERQLRDFAKTKSGNLPDHVKKAMESDVDMAGFMEGYCAR